MHKVSRRSIIIILSILITLSTLSSTTYAASYNNKRQEYYQQYQTIIQKVNTTEHKNLKLKDISAISEDDLIAPSKLEQVVIGRNVCDYDDIVSTANMLRSSSDLEGKFSKTKSVSITVYSNEKVTISCKVSGTYIYDKSRKRCLFGQLNKPTFTVKNGKWKNRGYGQKTIDAGRTLTLTIQGKAIAGSNMTKNFRKYMEFAMNVNGEIG